MSGYLLERTNGARGFVTPPGSDKSYTHDLELALLFATREAAEAERCVGNERVVEIEAAHAARAGRGRGTCARVRHGAAPRAASAS